MTSGRIAGLYPGGPRRTSETGRSRRPLRLADRVRRAEEMLLRDVRRRRRLRRTGGLLLVILFGATAGFMLGRRAGRLHETDPNVAGRSLQSQPSSREVNRVLLELWKMEDLERAPRPGGFR